MSTQRFELLPKMDFQIRDDVSWHFGIPLKLVFQSCDLVFRGKIVYVQKWGSL